MTEEYLAGLVRELCKLPHEIEWVEFKRNNAEPQEIGEYISAIANAAAINKTVHGYVMWGVDDDSHEIVGTTFKPHKTKKGNEPLETWLLRLLNPKLQFEFHELIVDGLPVVLLEINRATRLPVSFYNKEYIRIGSVKKLLKDAPDRERTLWRIFDEVPFENLIAAQRLSGSQALDLLDYPSYFHLLNIPLPEGRDGILDALQNDSLIRKNTGGSWDITNLGAMLFARKLGDFKDLKRKAIRVIQYKGNSRIESKREQEGGKGYAAGFEGLIGFINGLVPANEVMGKALRKTVPMFPPLAIRELVANALIHQDFSERGTGPMVEIFDDRIEITNPGVPLVDTQRFVDTPPKSRNETLASMMRRFGICEERGSGIDKVVFQIEYYQLPAPLFEVPESSTRIVLFAHKDLKDMVKADRLRTCYLHACLKYVSREHLTNASLRERLGIDEKNKATVSRYIREAVKEGIIKPYDGDAGRKFMKYLPFWA